VPTSECGIRKPSAIAADMCGLADVFRCFVTGGRPAVINREE
jgi:hypothetical protein